MSRTIDDKLLDSILAQALSDEIALNAEKSEQIYQQYKNGDMIKTSFSYNRKMNTLIREMDAPAQKHYSFKKVALLIAVLITLLISSVIANANGFRLFQWLGFTTSKSTDFKLTRIDYSEFQEQFVSSGITLTNLPSYIPSGYAIDSVEATPVSAMVRFTKADDDLRLSIMQIGNSPTLTVDTEDANTKTVKVKDMDAFYSEKESVRTLTFSSNDRLYIITSCSLPYKELLKIAESIEMA